MRIFTYDEAFTLVSDAHAVRVDDSELLYPDCDEDDNTITINSEHNSKAIIISKRKNKKVTTNENGELVFKDTDGNDVVLMLLVPQLIK